MLRRNKWRILKREKMDTDKAMIALPLLSELAAGHKPSSVLHGHTNLVEGGLNGHTFTLGESSWYTINSE